MKTTLLILVFEMTIAIYLLFREHGISHSAKRISVICIILSFFIRALCINHYSADYLIFLSNWMEQIRSYGGFASLAHSIGNYNIPYLAIMSLFSYININDMYLIKLLSILFDIILAWSVMKTVLLMTKDYNKSAFAYACVLLYPTFVINSSFWGQCDSIYVALGVLGLYLALDDRPVLSIACIAVSFAFKLQAVFIMPIYAVLWMKGKIKWQHFFFFPIAYLIMILPSVAAGRGLRDALLLYFEQADTVGTGYAYNAPSFLAFFEDKFGSEFWFNSPQLTGYVSKAFVYLTALFLASVLLFLTIQRRRVGNYQIILTATLFSLCIPFLLPHMHERYFYYAETMTLTLAFINKRFIPISAAVEFISLSTYWKFYTYATKAPYIPIYMLSLAMGISIISFTILYLIELFNIKSTAN